MSDYRSVYMRWTQLNSAPTASLVDSMNINSANRVLYDRRRSRTGVATPASMISSHSDLLSTQKEEKKTRKRRHEGFHFSDVSTLGLLRSPHILNMCLFDHHTRVYRAVSMKNPLLNEVTLSEGFSSPDYSAVSTLGLFIRRSHWSRTERNARCRAGIATEL